LNFTSCRTTAGGVAFYTGTSAAVWSADSLTLVSLAGPRGIYSRTNSRCAIKHSNFYDNKGTVLYSAIYGMNVTSCIFCGNAVDIGGGTGVVGVTAARPFIVGDCVFSGPLPTGTNVTLTGGNVPESTTASWQIAVPVDAAKCSMILTPTFAQSLRYHPDTQLSPSCAITGTHPFLYSEPFWRSPHRVGSPALHLPSNPFFSILLMRSLELIRTNHERRSYDMVESRAGRASVAIAGTLSFSHSNPLFLSVFPFRSPVLHVPSDPHFSILLMASPELIRTTRERRTATLIEIPTPILQSLRACAQPTALLSRRRWSVQAARLSLQPQCPHRSHSPLSVPFLPRGLPSLRCSRNQWHDKHPQHFLSPSSCHHCLRFHSFRSRITQRLKRQL
jgi:hypothetical protein